MHRAISNGLIFIFFNVIYRNKRRIKEHGNFSVQKNLALFYCKPFRIYQNCLNNFQKKKLANFDRTFFITVSFYLSPLNSDLFSSSGEFSLMLFFKNRRVQNPPAVTVSNDNPLFLKIEKIGLYSKNGVIPANFNNSETTYPIFKIKTLLQREFNYLFNDVSLKLCCHLIFVGVATSNRCG